MSQKLKFLEDVENKTDTFSGLCRKYNISRTLGYRYLARFKQKGYEGLAAEDRTPHYCPHQTPKHIEKVIIDTRLQYPEWGARKLHRIITLDHPRIHLPALSTITTILKRNHLIDKEESMKRQALGRFEKEAPNELWQMDFKGYFSLTTKARCYPLTILDDHSRYSIAIKALGNEQGKPVMRYLELIFREFGLPLQINVDNGNPWGNSQGARHTYVTVWLLRLGIEVTHSRVRHPQTNGKLERFHRTLKREVIKKNTFDDFEQAQKAFDEWQPIYNSRRPHEALDMKVPAQYYQRSSITFPDKLPVIEYDAKDTVRQVRGNGHIGFQGRDFAIGEAFSGFKVALKPSDQDGYFLVYFGKNIIKRISFSRRG